MSVGVSIGMHDIKFDASRLLDTIDNLYPPFERFTLTKNTNWLEYHLLPGFCLIFPLKKFSIEIKGMAGISLYTSPSLSYYGSVYGPNNPYTLSVSNSFTFSSQLALSIKYAICDHLSLDLNASVFYSDARFKITEAGPYPSNYPTFFMLSGSNDHFDATVLDIKTGITYGFGNTETIKYVHKEDSATASPSGYIAINAGTGLPQGLFNSANSTYYNNSDDYGIGSFALSGLNISLSCGIPIAHSNFGIAGYTGYILNRFDTTKFRDLSGPNLSRAGNIKWGNCYYKEVFVMAGLFITAPLNKFSFDFKLMAGPAYCTTSEVQWSAQYPFIQNYDYMPANDIALAFDGGIGIRYSFTKKLCVLTNLDYIYTRTSFTVYQSYNNNNGGMQSIGTYPYPIQYPISLLNLTLGIGYQFGK